MSEAESGSRRSTSTANERKEIHETCVWKRTIAKVSFVADADSCVCTRRSCPFRCDSRAGVRGDASVCAESVGGDVRSCCSVDGGSDEDNSCCLILEFPPDVVGVEMEESEVMAIEASSAHGGDIVLL
ncbi:uncharacterized protein LOC126236975 [Schistocerca nitens]|uniref:uncharacterized protein LOC126236975 n=1 Tax=Schistocerca nitens TaxID=7011 RepID=UPI0021177566|nr:uncharacterized protein LOC126236975 [Schistocerca nitens]